MYGGKQSYKMTIKIKNHTEEEDWENQGKYREIRDKHNPWHSVCGEGKKKVKEREKRRTMMTTKQRELRTTLNCCILLSDMC
jgi:hypothetical protein